MLIRSKFPTIDRHFYREFKSEPSVFLGQTKHVVYNYTRPKPLSIRVPLQGHFNYLVNGRELFVPQGHMLVINSDSPYSSFFCGPGSTETLSVFFGPKPRSLVSYEASTRFSEIVVPLRGDIGGWLLETRKRMNKGTSHEIDEGFIADGLSALLREREFISEPTPVKRAKALLTSTFRESWNIDRLADEVGLSKYHLIRKFNDTEGTSPMRYLKRCRAEFARSLMADSNLTMLQIAMESGFGSRAALYRAIRRHSNFRNNKSFG